MNKTGAKKCNVRWDEPLSYQDKHLFFENKEQFKRFTNQYREILRFVSHATSFHKDGTVTMTI